MDGERVDPMGLSTALDQVHLELFREGSFFKKV